MNDMMIDHVEAARRRIAELQQDIDQLSEFVRTWERVAHLLNTPLKDLPMPPERQSSSVDGLPEPETSPAPARRSRVTDNPKPAVVVNAAVHILRAHGRPMSRRDLHAALVSHGVVVRGADPIKALGTMLWRASDELVSIEGRGYWPKSDPLPSNALDDLLG